jgi:hypothetical protein
VAMPEGPSVAFIADDQQPAAGTAHHPSTLQPSSPARRASRRYEGRNRCAAPHAAGGGQRTRAVPVESLACGLSRIGAVPGLL